MPKMFLDRNYKVRANIDEAQTIIKLLKKLGGKVGKTSGEATLLLVTSTLELSSVFNCMQSTFNNADRYQEIPASTLINQLVQG